MGCRVYKRQKESTMTQDNLVELVLVFGIANCVVFL